MDDLERRIAALEAMVRRLVRVAPLARTSSTGNGDQIEASPADGAEPATAYTTQRFQHAGFKSVPVVDSGARAVAVFARGGAMNGAIVAEDDGYDPGLEKGEAVVYSPAEHSCRIWFDKDGVLHIDAKAAKDIVFNAGTAKVALHGDATVGHTHTIPILTGTANLMTGVVATVAGVTGSATDTINIPGTRRMKGA